jgi:hypothetical protein
MAPVHSTSRWVAKFQLLELSNVSSSNWNLVAHITTSCRWFVGAILVSCVVNRVL